MISAFPMSSIVHEGRPQRGVIIRCSQCNADQKIVAANHTGSLPPEASARKFRQLGWEVGKNRSHDTCPACVAKRKIKLTVVAENKDMGLKDLAAQLPKAMSREDKRLIFGKIDGVYLDEKRGYENGWSDLKVAEDLGVPLAWVKTVREADFGPEGLSADARTVLSELTAHKERMERVSTEIAKLSREMTELRTACVRLDRISAEMERTFLRRA